MQIFVVSLGKIFFYPISSQNENVEKGDEKDMNEEHFWGGLIVGAIVGTLIWSLMKVTGIA